MFFIPHDPAALNSREVGVNQPHIPRFCKFSDSPRWIPTSARGKMQSLSHTPSTPRHSIFPAQLLLQPPVLRRSMTPLQIVPHPHPALRRKSREIVRIDAELHEIVRQMFELMYAARGVGLAANQVGLPYRLFVINPEGDPNQKDQELVFLNPRITKKKGSEDDEEGCLSLPEIYGPVTRATELVVDAFDLSGRQFELKLSDFPARIIQHENDHLDGVLFIDRLQPTVRNQLQPLIADLEKQFSDRQRDGLWPSDQQLQEQLVSLEKLRT